VRDAEPKPRRLAGAWEPCAGCAGGVTVTADSSESFKERECLVCYVEDYLVIQ